MGRSVCRRSDSMREQHRHHSRFTVMCWRCWWFTISFPIEHFLWEKAPVLRGLTRALGL